MIEVVSVTVIYHLNFRFKNLAGEVYSDDLLSGVSERSVRDVRRSRKSRDEYRTRFALQRMSKFERTLRKKVPTRRELLNRRNRLRHKRGEDAEEDEETQTAGNLESGGRSSSRRTGIAVGEILELADVEDLLADSDLQQTAPPEAAVRHSKRKRVRRQLAASDDEDFTIEAE